MIQNLNIDAITNLKNKIDALIEKGTELSEGLSIDEQYGIMEKIISEGVSKATLRIYNDVEAEFTKKEIKKKMEGLKQFAYEYFEKKYCEYRVKAWEKKRRT